LKNGEFLNDLKSPGNRLALNGLALQTSFGLKMGIGKVFKTRMINSK